MKSMDDNEEDLKPAAIVESIEDDDEDDWSRRVETDDTTINAAALHEESFRMESVTEEDDRSSLPNNSSMNNNINRKAAARNNSNNDDDSARLIPPPPSHPELSMKEKLVLRERQRRIETERARLKRQFAMSNGDYAIGEGGSSCSGAEDMASSNREAGSVTEGTLGEESTRAHPDPELKDQERLGFNMERFLRNSDTFDPQLEPTSEEHPTTLMDRFLNDPVQVVPPPPSNTERRSVDGGGGGGGTIPSTADDDDVQRSVSFEVVEGSGALNAASAESLESQTNVSTNASIEVEAGDDVAREPLTPMTSMDVNVSSVGGSESGAPTRPVPVLEEEDDEPRVLRLTEADMHEMAAIEEASLGNAPPSEREEEMLSEIGELAGFGPSSVTGFGHDTGTPTTAQESASLQSSARSGGNPPGIPPASTTTASDHDLDGIALPVMPGGSSFSSQSPRAEDRGGAARAGGGDGGGGRVGVAVSDSEDGIVQLEHAVDRGVAQPRLVDNGDVNNSMSAAAAADSATGPVGDMDHSPEGLVNRVLRPGLILDPRRSPPPTSGSAPLTADAVAQQHVDGFDFDKHAPTSPVLSSHRDDSYRDLPPDMWSPPGKMNVSPIVARSGVPLPLPENTVVAFPRDNDALELGPRGSPSGAVSLPTEKTPLIMGDVPPEIITPSRILSDSRIGESQNNYQAHLSRKKLLSIGSMYRSLVSDLRSEEESTVVAINNESEFYLASSMLKRAFPERLFALTVTLIFEIPVLLMISGGSDALCELIGRSRYQLLMGFLPLTSAISGNVGLQASTLTTRAISHCHVTAESYLPWLISEIGAACYLGMGMGSLLGIIAFFASSMDFAFAVTIMFAQFISIVTAGCTGTFAPLLFSFIFKRDSGKWGGPLETAIQDIVGSFAMVVISYRILKLLGPGPLDPNDVCGAGDADDL